MTDSHMAGGHRPPPKGASTLSQLLYVVGIGGGIALLAVLAAFLTGESTALRNLALAVIALLVIAGIALRFRRHRTRVSLDDVLRSRRP